MRREKPAPDTWRDLAPRTGPDDAEPIRQALIEYLASGEAMLRERFERTRAAGDLPATADCATLAAYLMAMAHGLAVQAKAGFRHEVLQAVARQTLAGWPTDTGPPRPATPVPREAGQAVGSSSPGRLPKRFGSGFVGPLFADVP